MKKIINLFEPAFGKEEEKIILKTLRSKFWASGAGVKNVAEFEKKFNEFIGSKNCIAVNSGTAALHLALTAYDVKNKEVILPSLSFVSTANSVLYNGGIPKFVDIDSETLCIDANEINNSISSKSKIVLPVHFGGFPAKIDNIKRICKNSGLTLIEDAAHASGSTSKKKKIGNHGDAVCFSFHPVKNLAMPTGGAITLNGKNSAKISKILKSLRWCGISDRHGYNYDVTRLGWNYYMNEFSAAIGISQLKKLTHMNSKRIKIAKRYFSEIKIPEKMPFNKECSYHLYWILVKNRGKFMKKMRESGIETGIHYKPIHKLRLYNKKISLPNTDRISEQIVSLPMHYNLTNDEVSKIINCTNKFAI